MFVTASFQRVCCGVAAKPKVADYPFTTLVPNLGVCEMNYQTTVFADIPGQTTLLPLAFKTRLVKCALQALLVNREQSAAGCLFGVPVHEVRQALSPQLTLTG